MLIVNQFAASFRKLHDYNEDNHLDGHELRAAFASESDNYNIRDIEARVDKVLEDDDMDNDGKISWDEFLGSFHLTN